MNPFIGELITYLFKYVVLLAIAIGGVICGKKLKDSKEQKKAEE